MGDFIKKIKKYILKKNTTKESNKKDLSFEQLIEKGENPNFHGNNKVYNISIGNYSYVSFNSIVYHANIGNFCSIGPNVVIGFGDHPIDMISTSPHIYLNNMFYDINETNEFLLPHFKKVQIENDVWIGANVYIKNGVKIGNGAIIGAGSVVLKDVNDYEIVFGIPATFYKKRFNDEVVTLLLESKWWLLDIETLKKYKETLTCPNVENLVEMLKEISKNE
jgi:acetyltransferase-like isoleucine patch superfamily enzyme